MNSVGNLPFSCSNNPCVLSNVWDRRECMKHSHVILRAEISQFTELLGSRHMTLRFSGGFHSVHTETTMSLHF